MEIRGVKANLKFERKMDRRYKRFSAALFIQRIWRGCACRGRISRIRYAAWKFIDIAGRRYKPEKDEELLENSFAALKEYGWLANAKNSMEKVI